MGMGKDLCQGKDILLVIIHPFFGGPCVPCNPTAGSATSLEIGDWPSPPVVSGGSTYLNGSRLLGRMDSMIYILRRAMELVNCLSCCSYSYAIYIHYISIYIYLATYVWGKNLVKQTSWLTMALTPRRNPRAASCCPRCRIRSRSDGDRIGVKPIGKPIGKWRF